jgi:HEPN domain-containing protein
LSKAELASIVVFHAQQTIEKSYKALLVYYGQSPPRVHDLSRLAMLVGRLVEDPTYDPDVLERITQYYVQSRYPLMYEAYSSTEPSSAEVEAMVWHAKRVFDFASTNIV